jgi:hypothetical protein
MKILTFKFSSSVYFVFTLTKYKTVHNDACMLKIYLNRGRIKYFHLVENPVKLSILEIWLSFFSFLTSERKQRQRNSPHFLKRQQGPAKLVSRNQ